MKKFLIFFGAVFFSLITFSNAETFKVDCNKGKTISKILLNANPGDTIIVSGVCVENIKITKDKINLIGDGKPIIRGEGKDVITLESVRGVVINGFTIENGESGLVINDSSATCSDLLIQENLGGYGIVVKNNSLLYLNESSVKNNKIGFILTRSSSLYMSNSECSLNQGNGLDVWYNCTLRADNNIISDNGGSGIDVGAGSSLRLSGNQIKGNTLSGIALTQQATASLRGGNSITGNAGTSIHWRSGINLNFGSSAVIDNADSLGPNLITGNYGNGIHVSSQSVIFLTSARINNNFDNGIYLGMNSTAQFEDNVHIQNNSNWGIECGDWDGDSKFAGEVTVTGNGGGEIACGSYW